MVEYYLVYSVVGYSDDDCRHQGMRIEKSYRWRTTSMRFIPN